MPASPAPPTRPQTAPCAIALRGPSSPARNSRSTDRRTRHRLRAVPSIPNRRDHLKSPATSLERTLRVKINSLGKPCLSLVPRPKTAARLALHIGMSGQPGDHPRYCRGRGAVDSGERQGRQSSKIDILAGPHACGGREPFGTGTVRRHDLPRRSPPLSRTWLNTFWTPAMFRACVVTLSSSGRLLAMPIRYTIPFTVSTV